MLISSTTDWFDLLVVQGTLENLLSFSGGSDNKEPACNAGDPSLIPKLGRPPGEGNGYLLQYPSLENSMDCIVHGVTKSWTGLTFTFTIQKRSSPDAILGLSRPSFFWLQKNISEIFLPYVFQRSPWMQRVKL